MIVPATGFGGAVFLVLAISLAGVVHVLWLRSDWSKAFGQALDGGLTFRGRRLFGANKRVRGLLVMPVASALTFASFAALRDRLPDWLATGTWDLTVGQYAVLGFACGLAFMLAELPNSFLKRQLDVPPGGTPRQPLLKPVCFVLDRVDSTLGVMLVVAMALPVTGWTWFWVVVLGPLSHAVFSAALHRLGEKSRPL